MIQKLMLYGIPVSLLLSGWYFPIGVIIYWVTQNLFSLGQQYWVLHKYPPPVTEGSIPREERQRAGPRGRRPRSPASWLASSRCKPPAPKPAAGFVGHRAGADPVRAVPPPHVPRRRRPPPEPRSLAPAPRGQAEVDAAGAPTADAPTLARRAPTRQSNDAPADPTAGKAACRTAGRAGAEPHAREGVTGQAHARKGHARQGRAGKTAPSQVGQPGQPGTSGVRLVGERIAVLGAPLPASTPVVGATPSRRTARAVPRNGGAAGSGAGRQRSTTKKASPPARVSRNRRVAPSAKRVGRHSDRDVARRPPASAVSHREQWRRSGGLG